ncbi:MAG: DNA polymerase/3'-5' exonuclease PolX [Candidatus Marinimicrobia bacterium]|nr:DNA polymerase/3'-5' exonuclease PolX [Candidatus Neomarinimicrobiota bacterium]
MNKSDIKNEDIAKVFKELGAILEIKGENPFKARAYYNAARIIEKLPVPMKELIDSGEISNIKGIGNAVIKKSKVLIETGKLPYYEDLKSSIPEGLLEMLKIPGLGPRKIRKLWVDLGITNIGELEYACDVNRLVSLEGFGLKTQQKILEGIKFLKKYSDKHYISEGIDQAKKVIDALKECKLINRISVAGSIRRKLEIVRNIDVVISSVPFDLEKIFNFMKEKIDRGAKIEKNRIEFSSPGGLSVDLYIVTDEEFPVALFYYTGSQAHYNNIKGRLIEKGFDFDGFLLKKGKSKVTIENEEDIYRIAGLPFIPPELRENIGEIELASSGKLSELIEWKDIKGCFHIHSNFSDGISTIEELVWKARELGFSFISIADHSKSAFYANGLDEERLKEQWEEIERVHKKYPDFKIFKSIESDILADGSLDYTDDILAKFDFVIASVHSRFNLSNEEQTNRILRAIRNPFVKILGHPTGRLLLAREGYDVDLEKVLRELAKLDKAVEINASPHRLDLDWRWGPLVRELNLKVAINPDAHNIDDITDVEYGMYVARKSGIPKKNILNTWEVGELEEFFRKRVK